MDLLDIATIRDTRAGKGARTPKDPKLRSLVMIWPHDTLEEKTLTIVSGPDFTTLNYINFCCNNKETAKVGAFTILILVFYILWIWKSDTQGLRLILKLSFVVNSLFYIH